jgi:hypothetical protein
MPQLLKNTAILARKKTTFNSSVGSSCWQSVARQFPDPIHSTWDNKDIRQPTERLLLLSDL